jgi:hypothetical protein
VLGRRYEEGNREEGDWIFEGVILDRKIIGRNINNMDRRRVEFCCILYLHIRIMV